ncbi:hypothetical protein [Paenibacillus sp. CF384]|nr:hypothetical protein [Paenibacillus sp. CF384]
MDEVRRMIEELKKEIPELHDVQTEELIAFIQNAIILSILQKQAE